MINFPIHTLTSAPEASRELLEIVKKRYGFLPNLLGVLAEAPPALKAYVALGEQLDQSTLDPIERQIVLLSTSFENKCHYCMAAHSGGAKMQKMPEEVLQALRDGKPIDHPKWEALRRMTQVLVRERGWVPEKEIEAFLSAGYAKRQLWEILIGVAQKTLSNYVNHLAHTPLDEAFKPLAWTDPDGTGGDVSR